MSSLTELLLDCNEITSLPLSIGRLTELQVFYNITCRVYALFTCQSHANNTHFSLLHQTLSCIPELLTGLQILNLDGNRLSVLPPEVRF